MREIKFRAWHKKEKRWYKGDESCLVISEHGELYQLTPDGAGWDISEKYEICMFTGLHDKNGKEIYEGDILQWTDGDMTKGVVEWWQGDVGYFLGGFDTRPVLNGLDGIRCEQYSVIGNIYETPELLKDHA